LVLVLIYQVAHGLSQSGEVESSVSSDFPYLNSLGPLTHSSCDREGGHSLTVWVLWFPPTTLHQKSLNIAYAANTRLFSITRFMETLELLSLMTHAHYIF
jgi:hypothetical protein